MTHIPERPLLAIWGASGHAMVVADIVRLQNQYKIAGFLDDCNPDRQGNKFCGATILGGREQLNLLPDQGVRYALLGFGHCMMRLELTGVLQSQGLTMPVAVHPMASVAQDVVLGPGTVIAAGAVVSPGTIVGSSVIINTSASVDHECILGDAVHICPGAHLGGRVVIGKAAQIAIGATVIDRVHIGEGSFIGAGAVVVRDIPDHVVAYGVPARVKRMTNLRTA